MLKKNLASKTTTEVLRRNSPKEMQKSRSSGLKDRGFRGVPQKGRRAGDGLGIGRTRRVPSGVQVVEEYNER